MRQIWATTAILLGALALNSCGADVPAAAPVLATSDATLQDSSGTEGLTDSGPADSSAVDAATTDAPADVGLEDVDAGAVAEFPPIDTGDWDDGAPLADQLGDGLEPPVDVADSSDLADIGNDDAPLADVPADVSACVPADPATETCNGLDDDCNGQTDENTCDDSNVCTTDACVIDNMGVVCAHEPTATVCSDGNACTIGDLCEGTACKPGVAAPCDDLNPCTDDACLPASGCSFVANTLACDDGDACTTGDQCQGGACISGGAKICDDGLVCTLDSCDKTSGCVAVPLDGSCDDGNACTLGDACQGGACLPGAATTCDDGLVCTTDSCDKINGCSNVANSAPCQDGSACTSGDTCANGVCGAGPAVICDDNNVCTDDSCDPAKGCVNIAAVATCTDGDACTLGDACAYGACQGGGAANCDDGQDCTTDSCDKASGCVHASNNIACSDGSACTQGDQCQGGACQAGGALDCNDNNPCTSDSCDASSGCVHLGNALPCDDNNACTVGDACQAGLCLPGAATVCNDGNPCTDDSCDVSKGCVTKNNILPCTDNSVCTLGDACGGGVCLPGAASSCDDDNGCTTDSCDAKLGCQHVNTTAACDDGSACTAKDACQLGVCKGQFVQCDDGNPCTTDGCDTVLGCYHTNNQSVCDDGNACTGGDACAKGSCQPGAALPCDDGNACTIDACDPKVGCVFSPANGLCDPSLVGWWHFSEGSGSSTVDSSGHNHTLTLQGGPTWQAGWNDNTLLYNGKATYLSATPSADFQFSQALTVQARVRLDALTGTWQIAVSKHLDFRLGYAPDGSLFGSVRTADGTWHDFNAPAAKPKAGTWHHLTLSYGSNIERLYLDGLEVANLAVPAGGIYVSNQALNIGRSTEATYYCNGAIDEVRIFNKERTAAQILDDATLLAQWDMDDGAGKLASDKTGNTFDLQVVNATWQPGKVGTALQFDGKTAYAETKKTAGLDPNGTSLLTAMAWLNWNTAHCGVVHLRPYWVLHLGCGSSASPVIWYLGQGGWKMVASPLNYAAGQWHHVAGTYDGAAMKLYVDGGLVASAALTGGLTTTADGAGNWLVVGKDYDQTVNDRWYDGLIDGVRVYSRALTAVEVGALAGK